MILFISAFSARPEGPFLFPPFSNSSFVNLAQSLFRLASFVARRTLIV